MRAWTASDILNIWEEGKPGQWIDRGLLLLAACDNTKSIEALSTLTIGERDACILEMQDQLFGPQLHCTAACPQCRQQVEFELKVPDLKIQKTDIAGDIFTINEGDYQVSFRLPNSDDLTELPEDEILGRRQIIQRCISLARRFGREVSHEALPERILSAVAGYMAELDPQADLQMRLECPQCNHRWFESFDILSFLWSEIQSYALRLLREVHILASAYGWSESKILALSSIRRQAYMELIGT
jgi:hypothetical protein